MLIETPAVFQRRRPRGRALLNGAAPSPPPPPPVALALVAATYQSGTWVRLTFDRPIDIASANVASVAVDDNADTGNLYGGTGTPTLTNPQTVQISLTQTGDASQPGTHLSAGAGTGIVAVDDGGTWAGVTGLGLPFP